MGFTQDQESLALTANVDLANTETMAELSQPCTLIRMPTINMASDQCKAQRELGGAETRQVCWMSGPALT